MGTCWCARTPVFLLRINSCKEKRNGFLFVPCPGRKLKKENGTKGTVPPVP
jgi:hypothetical protein